MTDTPPRTRGMLPPKSRVRYTPTSGPAKPATVLAKVSGVDAYTIRLSDGSRATVRASQIQSKVKGQSA